LLQKPSVYAIDFGTSNSLLSAVLPDGRSELVPLDPAAADPTVLRSTLFFSEQSAWHYGVDALTQYVEQGMRGRLLRSLKRFLPVRSFEVTRIGSKMIKLEEIIGLFLRAMRERANARYGADVRRVLLGRPARFAVEDEADQLAQERLAAAARLAGFDEVWFCPEPVAAAYDFQAQLSTPKVVLVADFGGGTSDFTVARLAARGEEVEVLSIGGVSIAGDALDGAIMRNKIAHHFGADVTYRVPFGHNTLSMPKALMEALCSPADTCLLGRRDVLAFLQDVKRGALGEDDRQYIDQLLCLVEDSLGFQVFESIEQIKRALSDHERAAFEFVYPGLEIHDEVTQREFAHYARDPVSRVFAQLDATLARAGVGSSGIDMVCCTGGTAKVAAVVAGIAERFPPEKVVRLSSLHAVIQGLAERAKSYL
jgi:hypothetical chaperone protein